MVHLLSPTRLVLVAALCGAIPLRSAAAASHKHTNRHRTSDVTPAATPAAHHLSACAAPLAAGQHDPSVREVRLQRDPDGGGTVTMCLVSRQAALINPSVSIGIFGKDGILAGTAAKAMPGKFQPNGGSNGESQPGNGQTMVNFILQVPSDPPLPARLNPTAMVQLAWDNCPDTTCARPAEQSLALLQTMHVSGAPDSDRVPSDTAPTAARPRPHSEAVVAKKPAKPHHHKHHSTASVASGTIY